MELGATLFPGARKTSTGSFTQGISGFRPIHEEPDMQPVSQIDGLHVAILPDRILQKYVQGYEHSTGVATLSETHDRGVSTCHFAHKAAVSLVPLPPGSGGDE